MQDEANIVKQYEEANVSGRIEILIKYYPNFIRLVEGYEQSLSFIIKEEKAYKHRQAKGELGVRVQTSGISDPTAREAIDNIMIMEAIRSGDLSSIIRDLDDEVSRLHEAEVATLQNMKEDYSVLQSTFYYLDPDAADTFVKYLECGRKTEKLAYDLDIKPEALKMQMCRTKKTIMEQTAAILNRKYQYQFGGEESCHIEE